MVQQDLYAFGVEYKEIQYEGTWDWFVKVNSIEHMWKHQPTYLISQFVFLFGGVATLLHAFTRGGRFPYLWLGAILHGMVVESLSYALPDVDNFWHGQTWIIFLGLRFPLHIICLYPCFIYNASVAAAKLKLPNWAEPFAVGILDTLIDIPYDIVSVNFLHWTWHDTDPNISDRHYWVPWNSYYFHSTFAASFAFFFHFSRRLICKSQGKWEADSWYKEILCTVIAALLGTPGGILLFVPVYHPLHDIFNIHSEVTYFILFAIFLLIIWSGDRIARFSADPKSIKRHRVDRSTWFLLTYLVLHYATFWIMPIFFNPEDEVSIGLKEPIGPCDEYLPIQTAFGMTLKKRKYLCATDYDEKYFDWHCLPGGKPPRDGAVWYTACGVPFPNRTEIIVIISLICLIASVVFTNLHFNSFDDGILESKQLAISESRKKGKNKKE